MSGINSGISHAGWRKTLLALAVVLASFLAPSRSFAVTSGPGVWDFMIFGNYDVTSLDNGNTFANPPSTLTNQPWNKELNNGYGGGVGLAYWFNDVVAFRLEAQTNLFSVPTSLKTSTIGSLQSSPLTGGIEVKLVGDPDYYLYLVVDVGGAYEGQMAGTGFFGKTDANAWTAYGDAGLGVNIDWVFIEAKVAYLPQAIPQLNPSLGGQSGFWYVPVTAGFNF